MQVMGVSVSKAYFEDDSFLAREAREDKEKNGEEHEGKQGRMGCGQGRSREGPRKASINGPPL